MLISKGSLDVETPVVPQQHQAKKLGLRRDQTLHSSMTDGGGGGGGGSSPKISTSG